MTEDELKAIENSRKFDDVVHELLAEVRRLRGLVAAAQFRGQWERCSTCHNCPWCGYDSTCNTKRKHAPECPAFTESGDVR